jgi:hypothetical protein
MKDLAGWAAIDQGEDSGAGGSELIGFGVG